MQSQVEGVAPHARRGNLPSRDNAAAAQSNLNPLQPHLLASRFLRDFLFWDLARELKQAR